MKYGWHKFSSDLALRKNGLQQCHELNLMERNRYHRDMLVCVTSIFIPTDYELMHKNTNVTHRNSNNGHMQRGELKKNAVPSLWPGCPGRLSKEKTERPTKMATSQARVEHEIAVRNDIIEEQIRENTFESIDDLKEKFDSASLSNNVTMIRNQSHLLFINICSEGKPIIRYCLKVNASLEYELWWNGEVLENNCVNNAPDLLNSCSMVSTMISYLGSLKERNVTDEERLRGIIENVDDMEHIEQKKLSFFTEQLSLILIKDPRRRRYSCDLLTMACMFLLLCTDKLRMSRFLHCPPQNMFGDSVVVSMWKRGIK